MEFNSIIFQVFFCFSVLFILFFYDSDELKKEEILDHLYILKFVSELDILYVFFICSAAN